MVCVTDLVVWLTVAVPAGFAGGWMLHRLLRGPLR